MGDATTQTLSICDPLAEGGVFVPLTQQGGERDLNINVRGVIYLCALLYMFMGVNEASNYFMNAIETITGKKRRVLNKKTGRYVTVLVWNDTVANLSLLALGSSAPEILLSCIELMREKFYSGSLGPSTIVGSAAFNLLVIVAVCIHSIPSTEVRAIKYMAVFHVTVLFSFFAYFWLLVMVKFNSENVVEEWEAVLTLAMFPIFVIVSFIADRGYLEILALERQDEKDKDTSAVNPSLDNEEDGSGAFHKHEVHPRLRQSMRRSSAGKNGSLLVVRKSMPSGSVPLGPDGRLENILPTGDKGQGICDGDDARPIFNPAGILTFREDALTVNGVAGEKMLNVEVLRRNGADGEVVCKYRTSRLTAVPGYDYEEVEKGILTFAHGETHCMINLKIMAKRDFERADSFQLILEDIEGGAIFNPNDDGGSEHATLTVTIANGLHVRAEGTMDVLNRLLERIADLDSFYSGLEKWRDQIKGAFTVPVEDEGEDAEEDDLQVDKLIKGAAAQPSPMDYIMHVMSLPWKVLFAILAPPDHWWGGWLLFFSALGFIGCITGTVADLASLFGCCFGFPDAATAITLVALGTSLPDLFASQTAARNDETADASIVNVTGSNSVNVFLGIGLPWTIAAFYWKQGASAETLSAWRLRYPVEAALYPQGIFVVQAKELGFSVLVFSSVAVCAICILRTRRIAFKGELGGPHVPKMISAVALVLLWFGYVGLSFWRISSDAAEVMTLPLVGCAAFAVVGTICVEFVYRTAGERPEPEVRTLNRETQLRSTQIRASQIRPSQMPRASQMPRSSLMPRSSQVQPQVIVHPVEDPKELARRDELLRIEEERLQAEEEARAEERRRRQKEEEARLQEEQAARQREEERRKSQAVVDAPRASTVLGRASEAMQEEEQEREPQETRRTTKRDSGHREHREHREKKEKKDKKEKKEKKDKREKSTVESDA